MGAHVVIGKVIADGQRIASRVNHRRGAVVQVASSRADLDAEGFDAERRDR